MNGVVGTDGKALWREFVGAHAPDVWDQMNQCDPCMGKGDIATFTKAGKVGTKRTLCPTCDGFGEVPAMDPVLKHYWNRRAT